MFTLIAQKASAVTGTAEARLFRNRGGVAVLSLAGLAIIAATIVIVQHLSVKPLQTRPVLIVADMEWGREQEAQAEALELNRISPHFHVAVGQDQALNKRWKDDLREA